MSLLKKQLLIETVDELFDLFNLDVLGVDYYGVLEVLNIRFNWLFDTIDDSLEETEDAEDTDE